MNSKNSKNSLVAIAKITKPRGLRGEVVAEFLTDFPQRFDALIDVTAIDTSGKRRNLKIENFRFQKDRIVLKFEGLDSIEAAETLRQAEICVDESKRVELETDEYFDWQLVDCEVETIEGERIGRVKEVMRTGGTENLVVAGEKEFLIPFAEAICREIDIEKKLIRVDLPDGLLEF